MRTLDLDTVQTNTVRADIARVCTSGLELREKLARSGIWVNVSSRTSLRFVTHYGVKSNDAQYTVEMLKKIKAGKG
jgi:threonine aldolase